MGQEKRQSAAYTIAADSGKGVVVTRIHEVEPDAIEWALPLRELATRLIQPLQARTIDWPDQHLTAQPLHRANLRHNRWPWWDGWCFSALHQLYLCSLFFLLLLHFHWRRLGLWVSGLSTSSRNRGAEHTQRPLLACLAWRRTAIYRDLRQHMIAQLNIILAKRIEIGWGHSTLG